MMIKKPVKPERPKLAPFLGWLGSKEPRWLIVEPRKIGVVGGVFFATLALMYYVLRQFFGHTMMIQEVVIGVTLTFVVGYAGTGLFVVYVLWVGERELPEVKEEKDRRKSERRTDDPSREDESELAEKEVAAEEEPVEEASEEIGDILEMISHRDEAEVEMVEAETEIEEEDTP